MNTILNDKFTKMCGPGCGMTVHGSAFNPCKSHVADNCGIDTTERRGLYSVTRLKNQNKTTTNSKPIENSQDKC